MALERTATEIVRSTRGEARVPIGNPPLTQGVRRRLANLLAGAPLSACAYIDIVTVLILAVLVQRNLIRGLTAGAIKA